MRLNCTVIRIRTNAIDMRDQLRLGDKPSTTLQQTFQRRDFFPWDINHLVVLQKLPANAVKDQRAQFIADREFKVLAPCQCAKAGLQLVHFEGLCQIVIRPGIQSNHPLSRFRAGGQKNDRRSVTTPTQGTQDLDPVKAGEVQIEHNQISPLLRKERVGLGSVVKQVDGMPAVPQTEGNSVRKGFVVFYDGDPHDYTFVTLRKFRASLERHGAAVGGGNHSL